MEGEGSGRYFSQVGASAPVAGHHRPLAGTHCAYPRRDGQAELTWVTGYILRQIFPHRELNPRHGHLSQY